MARPIDQVFEERPVFVLFVAFMTIVLLILLALAWAGMMSLATWFILSCLSILALIPSLLFANRLDRSIQTKRNQEYQRLLVTPQLLVENAPHGGITISLCDYDGAPLTGVRVETASFTYEVLDDGQIVAATFHHARERLASGEALTIPFLYQLKDPGKPAIG